MLKSPLNITYSSKCDILHSESVLVLAPLAYAREINNCFRGLETSMGIHTHQNTDPVVQHPRHVTLSPVPGQAVLHGGAAAVLEDEHAL